MGEPAAGDPDYRTARNVGLGCFMTVIGFFSGGMIGVLLGKVIEVVRRSPTCDGLPICNWYVYAGVGGALGALSLPALVLWRLRRPPAQAVSDKQERG